MENILQVTFQMCSLLTDHLWILNSHFIKFCPKGQIDKKNQHCSGDGLVLNRQQTIAPTNYDPVH